MPDVDLATILADGDYLKREGDELVGDPGSGDIVAAYPVPRIAGYAVVTTSAGGDFAVVLDGTFTPVAAICTSVGNLDAQCWFHVRDTFSNIQVVFRAQDQIGGVRTNATLGVCYVIYGPAP